MDRLFEGGSLSEWIEARRHSMYRDLDQWSPGEILSQTVSDLSYLVVARYRVGLISIDIDERTIEEPQYFDRDVRASNGDTRRVRMIRVVSRVPYVGNRRLLGLRPGRAPSESLLGAIDEQDVLFIFEAEELQFGSLRSTVDKRIDLLRRYVDLSRTQTEEYNEHLQREVPRALLDRMRRFDRDRAILKQTGIPLVPKGTGREGAAVPIKKRMVLSYEQPGAEILHAEHFLADQDYEEAVRVLTSFGRQLERTPKTILGLGEESLRDLFLGALNTQFEGGSGGEVFNGYGRTDIVVRWRGRNAFIGECKIWRGEREFSAGIDQLLRYITWRDVKAAILLFITKQGASNIIETARSVTASHDRCLKAIDSDAPTVRTDYILSPENDSSRRIRVAVLPFIFQPALKPRVKRDP